MQQSRIFLCIWKPKGIGHTFLPTGRNGGFRHGVPLIGVNDAISPAQDRRMLGGRICLHAKQQHVTGTGFCNINLMQMPSCSIAHGLGAGFFRPIS